MTALIASGSNAVNPRILISARQPTPTDDVCDLVRAAGYEPAPHPLGSVPPVEFGPLTAAIVCPSEPLDAAVAQTRRWRVELGDRFLPILWVSDDVTVALEAGADACLPRPVDAGLFAAHLGALLRTRGTLERTAVKADDAGALAERLRKAHGQHDRDGRLAQSLCRESTDFGHPAVRVGVRLPPTGGCFHGVWPAGDDVEFFLANVIGPAGTAGGLVGLFLRQVVTTAAVRGPAGPLPPGEILRRANEALVSLELADPPLAAMAFVRLTPATGRLSHARAGLPLPIKLPAAGDPYPWEIPGPYLGVAAAEYPTYAGDLGPGDKLILHAGGGTWWPRLATHRGLPAQSFVNALPGEDAMLVVGWSA